MSTPMALAFCAVVLALVLAVCAVAYVMDRRAAKMIDDDTDYWIGGA